MVQNYGDAGPAETLASAKIVVGRFEVRKLDAAMLVKATVRGSKPAGQHSR